jgi:TetR/AcrR family transcriptional regulator, cholesterol catabolism regulator
LDTDTLDGAALTRRERKKRDTRRRIYSVAFELFLEKGFDETTVEEIAERADVAKGTVFNYFPQKSSFLAAIFEHWVNRITEEMGPVKEWKGTTRGKLEQLFFFLAHLSAESPGLYRRAFLEHLRSIPDDDGCTRARHPAQEFATMIRAVLDQGQAAAEVRVDLDMEHGASLVESAVFKTLVVWLMEGGSLDDVRAEMSGKLDIVFGGIAPRTKNKKSRTSSRKKVRG